MGIVLNHSQANIVNQAVKNLKSGNEQVFQYSGGPGTGKSVVLNAIVEASGINRNRIAPMSFIGAAAIVMRIKGLHNAKTAHSWLYNPVQIQDQTKINTYFNRPNTYLEFAPKPLKDIDLIIVDEAGAMPYSLKHDIESHGIPIIACGDLNQLPPVMDKPAYLYDGKVHVLTEIMRQKANSGIVYLSDRLLKGLPIHNGYYGDAVVIDDKDLTDEMILLSDVIIAGKNKTRDSVNKYIREELLNIHADLPVFNEKLICRKNNWRIESNGISLATGLTGRVSNQPDLSNFDGKTFMINFSPDLMNGSFQNVICDYEFFKAPYNKKDSLKNNKYNKGNKFEFAYSITTHMSQGSQYANGIYLEEYLSPDINRNLNYTGITRFSNFAIYVKHRNKFI